MNGKTDASPVPGYTIPREVPMRSVVSVVLLGCTVVFLATAIDVEREIILPAQSYLGSGYCRGGESPPCFDCSGFISVLYRPFVPELPRISRDMALQGEAVSRSELIPGDLVFFATAGRRDAVTHVAIYIGRDSIIHAISDGPDRGVTITPLSARYWHTRFHSARRVIRPVVPEDGDLRAAEGEGRTAESGGTDGIRYADGRYRGDLRGGEPHGVGRFVMDNGDRYEGEFVRGTFEGIGVYLWQNGDRYDGSFTAGQFDGPGTFTSATGDSVSGTWRDGEYVERSGDAGEKASAVPETYPDEAESPWDTWDGILEGDYYAWRRAETESFEAFKDQDEEWRNNR
ncbi:MAG: NlpC/P60 family protein [Alkalispirochaeta sp.]